MSRRALLIVALVALAVRISFSFALAADDGPVGALGAHLLGDERAYDAYARDVAAGDWQRTRAFYQAPAYPWLLGQLYKAWPPPPLSGDDSIVAHGPVHRAVFAAQHLFGVVTALLAAILACRVLSPRAGLLVGLMAALSGPLVFHETMLLKSSLSLLIFVITLHLWLDVLERRGTADGQGPGARRAILLGVALGFGVLLRGNMLLLLGVVLASMVWPLGTEKRLVRQAVIVALCALAALSPVTIHNLRRGDLVLSTYQAGTNAAIGQPRSDSLSDGLIYQPLRAGRGDARYEEADAVAFAEGATGQTMTGREISTWWWRWVANSVAEHPVTAAQRVALKLVHLFHGYEVPDVKSWAVMSNAAPWLMTWASDLWLWGPLALLGLWALPWRRRPGLLVVRGSLGVVAVSLALFYVMGRYRLSALPCLWILAAGALLSWANAVTSRARSQTDGSAEPATLSRFLLAACTGRPGLGLAALAALLALERGFTLPSDVNGEHTSFANAASIACAQAQSASQPERATEHRDQAVSWAQAAIDIAPAFPSPRNTLVRALSLTTAHVTPRPPEALDASWRMLLLMDGLRTGHDVQDLLDGPIAGVRSRALQLMDIESTQGGQLYAGPLLAFACRSVAQHLSRTPETATLALALIDRSLSLAPEEAFAWMQRGALLRKLSRPAEATQSYLSALKAGEDSPELRNNLGNVLRSLGRFDEAVLHLEQALVMRPGDPLVQRNLDRARNHQ
ncbi:MAG: hypothetical protein ACI9EF_000949 [Pseudohongiellaceae bacterium]|jgi:hypothetical protein